MSFSSIEIPQKVFGGFDNIISCLLDEGIPKIWKKLNSHDGFLRAG